MVDRKLLERLTSPSPKSQVMLRPHSHESVIYSNFWDSDFSIYDEFGEFSLTFTAAVSAVAQRSMCLQRKRLAVLDFGPAWHCYSGQRAAYASGPTLTDMRHDEQRGSPYDAKCNVAEIGPLTWAR